MPIREREIDPVTGLITELGFEDGKAHIRYSQDSSALYAQNQRLRESDEYWRVGVKKGLMHGVSLSAADCLKMIVEDKVDPYKVPVEELHRHIWRNREKWGHCIVTKARIGTAGR